MSSRFSFLLNDRRTDMKLLVAKGRTYTFPMRSGIFSGASSCSMKHISEAIPLLRIVSGTSFVLAYNPQIKRCKPIIPVPPGKLFFSIKIVLAPSRAALIEAAIPATPPPTTSTSHSVFLYFISLQAWIAVYV